MGNKSGKMTYDNMYELIGENVFEVARRYLDEWKDFYPEAQ